MLRGTGPIGTPGAEPRDEFSQVGVFANAVNEGKDLDSSILAVAPEGQAKADRAATT